MSLIQVKGVSIHYHVEGTGMPIIFIHPPLLTSENFKYQKEQLSEKYKVITFDIRGHGRSGFSAEPISYPLIVDDMKQLMDHLEVKQAYVCGYSTGGSIALEAIITYPDRFIGGILVSAMSEISDWWQKSRIFMAIAAASMKVKGVHARNITKGNADSKTMFSNLFRSALKGETANWKQYYQYSLSYNCTARLCRIMAPILLIFGLKDKGFHRYADILHKQLPHNQLYMIKDAKHQIPTKNALKMNYIVDNWLAEQENLTQSDSKDEDNASLLIAHDLT
ncbi:MAG TPA: alpha/beta hydrolase [Bacilli bacterium]